MSVESRSAPSHASGDGSGPADKVSYVQLVPAVEQATRILTAIAREPRGSATLTEICRQVGINKSKGLAILNTLRGAGLVSRNERSKTYGLGLTLLTLSRALLDHTDLAREAGPYLQQIADRTASTALLCLTSGDQVFIVARREAAGGMGVTAQIGHRFPLTWGAHGKAILAALPEDERERLIGQEPLYVRGRPTAEPIDLGELRAELEVCRRRGYAYDLGVAVPGVQVVSAVLTDTPMTPSDDRPCPRVTGCLAAVGTFPADRADDYGAVVAAAAQRMSADLGWLL